MTRKILVLVANELQKVPTLKTNYIMAYHKLKKHGRNQVKNMMTKKILVLIANELQKVPTQCNEDLHQLANFSEANKTLKELVKVRNKKTTALENMLKALNMKKNQGNQQKYDNKVQMMIIERPSYLYCIVTRVDVPMIHSM